MAAPSFALVVPVKATHLGKSRLGELSESRRQQLAVAFACDTIDVALGVPAAELVVVVTADLGVAAYAETRGGVWLADPCPGDLNGALKAAVDLAAVRRPEATPVALLADLPALTVGELVEALSQTEPGGAPRFVADIAGSGSTLYAADYARFAPRFGPGSCAAHLAAGAIEIEGELAGLRHDVDDTADLSRALALGVGPLTMAALSTTDATRHE